MFSFPWPLTPSFKGEGKHVKISPLFKGSTEVRGVGLLLNWIISSFWPRHTAKNSQSSFCDSNNTSFFLNCFYHIFTTRGNMTTIGRTMKAFCPKRMVWRENFLIIFYCSDENFLWNIHTDKLRNKKSRLLPIFCDTILRNQRFL